MISVRSVVANSDVICRNKSAAKTHTVQMVNMPPASVPSPQRMSDGSRLYMSTRLSDENTPRWDWSASPGSDAPVDVRRTTMARYVVVCTLEGVVDATHRGDAVTTNKT